MITGKDVRIDSDAVIRDKDALIGSHIAIDKGFYCTTKLTMGDYIHLAPYCKVIGSLQSSFVMEDFSFFASGTSVICGSEDYTSGGLVGPVIPIEYRDVNFTTVTFKRCSGTGTNAVIMPGLTLGEGSVVGANSLLTKDTKPWGVYVGSPARLVGKRDKEKAYKHLKDLGYE